MTIPEAACIDSWGLSEIHPFDQLYQRFAWQLHLLG